MKHLPSLHACGFLWGLLLICLLQRPATPIRSTQPIMVNPNTESSPANFFFYFTLDQNLPADGYLMITFSPYTVSADPITCDMLSHSSNPITTCVNLASPASAITISQSGINEVNPNIESIKTIVMQFSTGLTAATEYQIQITTNNVLPNIGSITSSFEMYTVTATGVMIQENWNCGQAFLEPKQNRALSVLSRNSMEYNLPGTSFTDLLFDIEIGVNSPTPLSRLKFVIKGGFTFTDSSLVKTIQLVGAAPVLLTSLIESPNVIIATFNESFVDGRKFSLTIADIQNPLYVTSNGYISVYHLPDNSMSPLEISEESIPIKTIPFAPTINLITIDGTYPASPIEYYTSTIQYIKMTIVIPRDVEPEFVIQVESDILVIHEGSVYAKTSTVDAASLTYTHYSSRGFQISGFPLIPENSIITVTMRAEFTSTSIFTMTVKVDEPANLASPIIENSKSSVAAAIPETYLSSFSGSGGEANKVSAMQNSDSFISFGITSNFITNAGSKLTITTSSNMVKSATFDPATSCLVDTLPMPCSVTTTAPFTTIVIASNGSYNLFPTSTLKNVVINNLNFAFSSSHTEYIYHFYFSLTVSQAISAASKNLLIVPQVIPQREQLVSFGNFFSNDLNNTGSNFPNIVRLVSWDTAQWQNTVQAYERRIISIYAMQGWKSLFTLSSGDPYPCKSNIPGFTFTYQAGAASNIVEHFPLGWDRIDIVLDGSETSSDFSIIIPTSFVSASALRFEIMVGVVNVETRVVRYLNSEPQPISPNPTYRQADSTALSFKPVITTNKVKLAGQAGSYMNNVTISVSPFSGYSGTTYDAAILIVSEWRLFDDSSSFNSISTSSADPEFKYVQQSPLWIYLENSDKYLTYIPLSTASSSPFKVHLDNIKMPYSHDLPYYNLYLTDETGTIDCVNELINQDKGVFYASYLKTLTFTCNVVSLGVENTFCTVGFTPNNNVEMGSVFRLYFTGMQISTNMCSMVQSPSTPIEVTCESNTDKNELTISILNQDRLPKLQTYFMEIYGVSILDSTIIHYVQAELRDPTDSYVIEKGTRILLTSVADFRPIYITEVSYSKNNPIVYSSFTIEFDLPRQLNDDESLAIVMSKDLSNLNTVSSKLNVQLLDSAGVQIPAVWTLNLKYYQILFEGLQDYLTAASYTIRIYGLKTPSTIEQDLVGIIYVRKYDLSYTVYNNEESTQQFPSLSDKVNSFIIMSPFFNTEGLEQQLSFSIVNQYSPVTELTQWIINFPRYYSQQIWNEEYLVYCKIESSFIDCAVDPNTPYQILVSNSPRIIEVGDTYVLSVYGITCPRAKYLNGYAEYVTESIFMGISQNSSSDSFIEYSELFLVDTVINPENQAGYGSVTVTGIESSNMEVLQSTFFIIKAVCSVAVPANSWIYLTFPEQFDNFNDLSLTVSIVQGATDETYSSSEVVNRRIGLQMTGMSLSANTAFDIEISSLPTPSSPGIVDMNKLKIMVATSSRLGTIAASLQRHNLVDSIEFLPSQLHIVINNYQTIHVTAGTYSLPVKIQPSDFTSFVSNMKITFVSDALAFKTSPTYIYLGEAYSTFSVGADQTLIPTIYAFDIIKTESSISAFYTSLSKYTVDISNVPVQITVPSTINVPKGGCSVPYEIVLSNLPYSDININFEFDTELFNLHLFWLNEQISYNELEFDDTIYRKWLSFCSDVDIGLSAVDVKLFVGGTNYKSYQLSTEIISVNIIPNSTTDVTPTFTLEQKNLQKTYAGFDVTVNIPGQIFYQLELTPMQSPFDLVDLKLAVKESKLSLESQADFLDSIYLEDRDHRVGMQDVAAGINSLEFEEMLPGKSYTLCVWFENQHREIAEKVCQQFDMMDWGTMTKATISFTTPLYDSQLNKVLCFFVKASESEIDQVVDLEGHSCSLSNGLENYNYAYSGSTISSEKTETVIYFITNRNLTTDPSVALFSSIYDSNGIKATSLSYALSAFAINYIDSSFKVSTFDPLDVITPTSAFRPSFSHDDPTYNNKTQVITINNLYLSTPGAVYFILTFHKKIIFNGITGAADISIQSAVKPTQQQILNCRDGLDREPLDCKRVVLMKGEKMSITFSGIAASSVYQIYYAVANEYALRPVMVGSVGTMKVVTAWGRILGGAAMVLLLVALAV